MLPTWKARSDASSRALSMINLGIVVVYLVPARYERMLELHLRQIAKRTHGAYSSDLPGFFGPLVTGE